MTLGEITNQQYGTTVEINNVEKPIRDSMNLRSNAYNPGYTNFPTKYDAYGIEMINPDNITVPHRILNHLSGEYTVNSEILYSNDVIHNDIIWSIKNDTIIDAKRNEINHFLIDENTSLKCNERSSIVPNGVTSMVMPDASGRWL